MAYAWDVRSPDDGMGACGVSEDRAQALADLLDAMDATPSATHGRVHAVRPHAVHSAVYEYGGLAGWATRDAETGRITWGDISEAGVKTR